MNEKTVVDRPILDLSESLRMMLGDINGLSALDVGCGSGAVTRTLADLGAVSTGLEPNPVALGRAVEQGGERVNYVLGGIDQHGLAPASFDLVVFSSSLHHCPDKVQAVEAAARLVKRPGGRIVVREPVGDHPPYTQKAWIPSAMLDDENEVYAQAQSALSALEACGKFERSAPLHHAAKYRVETPDAMIADFIDTDGARTFDESLRAEFERTFYEAQERDAEGGYLVNWKRLDVLTAL